MSNPSVSPQPRDRPKIVPLVGIVLVSISMGFGHVIARWAYQHGLNILTAAAVRPLLTAALLLALLIVRRQPLFAARSVAIWTIPLGLCIAIQGVAIQSAVSLLPVGIAVLVMYLFPFLTGVASAWLGDVRFTPRLGAALGAALSGLALVVGVGTIAPDPLGVALALLAAIAFTTTLVLTPRLVPSLNATTRTFYTMLTAGVVLMAVALSSGRFEIPATLEGRLGLFGLAACYAVGISGLFLLLPRLGAVQIAVTLNLEPVLVAAIAAVVLGEAFTITQWLGAALVVGAVMFYQIAENWRR